MDVLSNNVCVCKIDYSSIFNPWFLPIENNILRNYIEYHIVAKIKSEKVKL